MNLWHDFLTNTGRRVDKWTHYFPIYEKHLKDWRNRTLTFLEIGVAKGGSLQMWKRYFGPMATIVGIDINPHCKEVEDCLLYTSPSPRDRTRSRMPSSA